MTPLERIRHAFVRDAAVALNQTVEQLAREGVTREVLDEALGLLLDRVRNDGGDETQEEIIVAVSDRLHSWCHASRAIAAADDPSSLRQ